MKRRHSECSCERNNSKNLAISKNIRELSRQVKQLNKRLSTIEHAMKKLENFLFETNTENLRKN